MKPKLLFSKNIIQHKTVKIQGLFFGLLRFSTNGSLTRSNHTLYCCQCKTRLFALVLKLDSVEAFRTAHLFLLKPLLNTARTCESRRIHECLPALSSSQKMSCPCLFNQTYLLYNLINHNRSMWPFMEVSRLKIVCVKATLMGKTHCARL